MSKHVENEIVIQPHFQIERTSRAPCIFQIHHYQPFCYIRVTIYSDGRYYRKSIEIIDTLIVLEKYRYFRYSQKVSVIRYHLSLRWFWSVLLNNRLSTS